MLWRGYRQHRPFIDYDELGSPMNRIVEMVNSVPPNRWRAECCQTIRRRCWPWARMRESTTARQAASTRPSQSALALLEAVLFAHLDEVDGRKPQ
jgi:hypothetical protein